MSDSKEDLIRKRGVYEAIIEKMAFDDPDRAGYEKDLMKIEAELEALEHPEQASESAPEPEKSGEGEQVSTPAAETERLVPPKGQPPAGTNKTEGKEKSAPKENNPLAGVSTKDLVKEIQRRVVEWMNKK